MRRNVGHDLQKVRKKVLFKNTREVMGNQYHRDQSTHTFRQSSQPTIRSTKAIENQVSHGNLHEAEVNLDIGKHDEPIMVSTNAHWGLSRGQHLPAITMAFLELSRGLCTSHAAGRILATANVVSAHALNLSAQKTHPMPIPSRNRYAVNAANSP